MPRYARAAGLAALLAAAGCAPKHGGLPQKAAPRGAALAVSYLEQNEKGAVRDLASGRAAVTALDVNSRVGLRIDAGALRDALAAAGVATTAGAELRALGDRVARLNAAAAGTGRVVAVADSTVLAWRAGRKSGDYAAFDRWQRVWATLYDSIVPPLDTAIQLRLVAEGKPPAEARRLAAEMLRSATSGSGRVYGFDWAVLGQLIHTEIAHLEQRLDRIAAEPGLQLSVRAYRFDRAGNAVPIRLDPYNDAPVGAPSAYRKLGFHVPEEQLRLYARYDTLARSMGEARSAGAAFRAALDAEFAGVRGRIEPAIAAAAAAVGTATPHLRALEGWARADALEQWMASLRAGLAAPGSPASVVLDSLRQSVAGLPAELAALRALAGLPATLGGSSPDQAMIAILGALATVPNAAAAAGRALDAERWALRARLARRLAEVAGAEGAEALLRSGPVGDLAAGAAALEAAARALEGAGRDVAAWIQRVALVPTAAGAESLPEPKANRRRPLAGNLDTSFDLATIPGGVRERDRIRVHYDIFHDGQPTDLGWHDDFEVGVYGLRSRLVAGLAFTHREGGAAWTPAPSLSWLASYRQWPADSTSGVGRPWHSYLGFGFSTMPLDFDPDQAVELGLAASAAVGDRLIGGFGANLQTGESRWFWFFSLRLFSAGGELGGPGGGP